MAASRGVYVLSLIVLYDPEVFDQSQVLGVSAGDHGDDFQIRVVLTEIRDLLFLLHRCHLVFLLLGLAHSLIRCVALENFVLT